MAIGRFRINARNKCTSVPPCSDSLQRTRISLKDWTILHAVVENGGFSQAAERLHCSQSSISYTVSKVQEQLGVSILKLSGRKAKITPEGIQILNRSKVLVHEALALEAYARNLYTRGAAEVGLGVDRTFPAPLLMEALARFSTTHRNIKVTLVEGKSEDIEVQLTARTLDLGITCSVPPGLPSKPLFAVEYVEVAHPAHPVFQGSIPGEAHDESFIEVEVLSLASQLEKINRRKPARKWSVNDIETALAAIDEGIGYAWLPMHRVSDLITEGRLQVVSDQRLNSFRQTVYLVESRPFIPGAESTLLGETIQSVVADAIADDLKGGEPNRMAAR